jgi:hypothetical protein
LGFRNRNGCSSASSSKSLVGDLRRNVRGRLYESAKAERSDGCKNRRPKRAIRLRRALSESLNSSKSVSVRLIIVTQYVASCGGDGFRYVKAVPEAGTN